MKLFILGLLLIFVVVGCAVQSTVIEGVVVGTSTIENGFGGRSITTVYFEDGASLSFSGIIELTLEGKYRFEIESPGGIKWNKLIGLIKLE